MLTINRYREIFLSEFYLDSQGVVKRSNDGYLGRFKKGDDAAFFQGAGDYWFIQVPGVRTTVRRSHLVLLLSGIPIPDDKEVDHIDGDRNNDHPSNLRVVNRRTNSCNRKKRSDNTSGVTGIRWSDAHGHYVIRKTVNGTRVSRSRKTWEEALVVLQELALMDADYTARHGS